jgi:hypothetical protein
MMMMGYGGMIWGSLLAVLILLGFAYIVWVLAAKEGGGIRAVGQIIAILIGLLALIILVYGTIFSGFMGRGWRHGGYGRGYWMGPGMMRNEMMDEYMNTPDGREWMDRYLEKNKQ